MAATICDAESKDFAVYLLAESQSVLVRWGTGDISPSHKNDKKTISNM